MNIPTIRKYLLTVQGERLFREFMSKPMLVSIARKYPELRVVMEKRPALYRGNPVSKDLINRNPSTDRMSKNRLEEIPSDSLLFQQITKFIKDPTARNTFFARDKIVAKWTRPDGSTGTIPLNGKGNAILALLTDSTDPNSVRIAEYSAELRAQPISKLRLFSVVKNK